MLIKDVDLELELNFGEVFTITNPPDEWPEPLKKTPWRVVKINLDEQGNYRSYDLRAVHAGNRRQRRANVK